MRIYGMYYLRAITEDGVYYYNSANGDCLCKYFDIDDYHIDIGSVLFSIKNLLEYSSYKSYILYFEIYKNNNKLVKRLSKEYCVDVLLKKYNDIVLSILIKDDLPSTGMEIVLLYHLVEKGNINNIYHINDKSFNDDNILNIASDLIENNEKVSTYTRYEGMRYNSLYVISSDNNLAEDILKLTYDNITIRNIL